MPQVGPKNAVAVLGGFPLIELVDAIALGERATLERIPGVGKRTAERILLDLREKVEPLRKSLGQTAAPQATPVEDEAEAEADQLQAEARAVLVNLGWKPKPVDAALLKVVDAPEPPDSLDALVRQTLALLMAR